MKRNAMGIVASSRQKVVYYLKKQIITCAIKPGELLSENELAGKLAVSRTPVREAFIELSKIGLIEVIPKRGSRVTRISYTLAEDACFIRESLEEKIVSLCCARNGAADYSAIELNLQKQELSLLRKDFTELLRLDDSFHGLLYELADKGRLYNYVSDLMVHFDRLRYLSLLAVVHLQTIDDHKKLAACIKDGRQKEAVSLLRAHLSRFKSDWIRIAEQFPNYVEA